jgi:hypothetical protein
MPRMTPFVQNGRQIVEDAAPATGIHHDNDGIGNAIAIQIAADAPVSDRQELRACRIVPGPFSVLHADDVRWREGKMVLGVSESLGVQGLRG